MANVLSSLQMIQPGDPGPWHKAILFLTLIQWNTRPKPPSLSLLKISKLESFNCMATLSSGQNICLGQQKLSLHVWNFSEKQAWCLWLAYPTPSPHPGGRTQTLIHRIFFPYLRKTEAMAWAYGSNSVFPQPMSSVVQFLSNKAIFMQGKLQWRHRPVKPRLDAPHWTQIRDPGSQSQDYLCHHRLDKSSMSSQTRQIKHSH